MSTQVLPVEASIRSLPVNTPQDTLLLLHFEYQLIQLGEDQAHIRKVLALFQKTRQFELDKEDEWRDFIRIWDEGLDQDSHYNAILDLICTSDMKKSMPPLTE